MTVQELINILQEFADEGHEDTEVLYEDPFGNRFDVEFVSGTLDDKIVLEQT